MAKDMSSSLSTPKGSRKGRSAFSGTCTHCGKVLTRKSDFERHVASHDKSKHVKCTFEGCNKTFAQKTALATHRNTHTGFTPHKCGVVGCTSAFKDPSSRKRHENEGHDPSRWFKCIGINCSRSPDEPFKRRQQFDTHFAECVGRKALKEDRDIAHPSHPLFPPVTFQHDHQPNLAPNDLCFGFAPPDYRMPAQSLNVGCSAPRVGQSQDNLLHQDQFGSFSESLDI